MQISCSSLGFPILVKAKHLLILWLKISLGLACYCWPLFYFCFLAFQVSRTLWTMSFLIINYFWMLLFWTEISWVPFELKWDCNLSKESKEKWVTWLTKSQWFSGSVLFLAFNLKLWELSPNWWISWCCLHFSFFFLSPGSCTSLSSAFHISNYVSKFLYLGSLSAFL